MSYVGCNMHSSASSVITDMFDPYICVVHPSFSADFCVSCSLCGGADPQHRPAMSEEAAAAIDADAARDIASQSKAHKRFSDSAHGFHDMDRVADGYTKLQKTADASQLAKKVSVAALGPACALVTGCCHYMDLDSVLLRVVEPGVLVDECCCLWSGPTLPGRKGIVNWQSLAPHLPSRPCHSHATNPHTCVPQLLPTFTFWSLPLPSERQLSSGLGLGLWPCCFCCAKDALAPPPSGPRKKRGLGPPSHCWCQ